MLKLPHEYILLMRLDYNIRINEKKLVYQFGGGTKQLKLEYIEKETGEKLFSIKFVLIYDNEGTQIYMSNEVNEKKFSNENSCVVISIDKNTAYIENLSSDLVKCIELEDFNIKNVGSFYLKMTIKMLKKYRNKLNINSIVLKDNSKIYCLDKRYSLSKYMMLTRGYSFYGKVGFKPIDSNVKELERYNKKIIKKLNINDLNWKEIIEKLKKHNNKYYRKNKELIKMFLKTILNSKENYIDIMKMIFNKENNDKTCHLYFELANFIEKELIKKYDFNIIEYNGMSRILELK